LRSDFQIAFSAAILRLAPKVSTAIADATVHPLGLLAIGSLKEFCHGNVQGIREFFDALNGWISRRELEVSEITRIQTCATGEFFLRDAKNGASIFEPRRQQSPQIVL
jgi:hypothetical protein